MNEMPEFEKSETVLICMKDGKFLAEDNDGRSTWIDWVDSILQAKIFGGVSGTAGYMAGPLNAPSYYQHNVPEGAKMVVLKVNTTGWFVVAGPPQSKPKSSLSLCAMDEKQNNHGVSDYAIDNPCSDDFK